MTAKFLNYYEETVKLLLNYLKLLELQTEGTLEQEI